MLIDIHLALLQIHSTQIGVGLLSPGMMLYNRPIRDLLPQMNRHPIDINNDDMHYEALRCTKENMIRVKILKKILLSLLQEL